MKLLFSAVAAAALVADVESCTNILVSKGASADGSTQIAYNADSGNLYGTLGHYPAQSQPKSTTRRIWDWDDAIFLGACVLCSRVVSTLLLLLE